MIDKKTQFYEQMLTDVARLWDVEISQIHRSVVLAGSPERSEYRTVVESAKGDLMILEKVFSQSYERKKVIAERLDLLSADGMERVIPYRKNRHGEHILPYHYQFWQIQDYFSGVELDRPYYAFDQWRGRFLADFLIELKQKESVVCDPQERPFSLKEYIERFERDVQARDPQYYDGMLPALDFLKKKFFPIENKLAYGFCHGDFHPLNVVWSPRGIAAVIDWEFCGMKPELYDAANMVGCLGIEIPQALSGECAIEFVRSLQDAGVYHAESWRYFFPLILAIRFGWMAEWLRKKDWEMVEMELDFWDILLEQRGVLATAWNIVKQEER